MKKNDAKKGSGLFGLFLAVLAALTVRSCAFEPYNIPSSSMVPTLLIGDYLFISKYPYGYSKHSFPFSIPFVGQGRVFASEPKRGDIVIFKEPKSNRIDYIKRVIGLPGETIEMREGRLYINGELIERKYIGQERQETEQGNMLYTRYTEVLPDGFEHPIYELGDYMQYDTYGPFTVPAEHYFMMGDNRDNSADSRYFGAVPALNLEGRAEFIFYSNNGAGYFFEFWKWGDSLRLDRFFMGIK